VRDGHYLSARWPGDAHRFASEFAAMAGRPHLVLFGRRLFEVSFHGTPGRRPAMTPINILYILQPKLFRSAFRFEGITYSAAGNNFALHGIAPEYDFGVQLVSLRS
jgi:hypothetical protein